MKTNNQNIQRKTDIFSPFFSKNLILNGDHTLLVMILLIDYTVAMPIILALTLTLVLFDRVDTIFWLYGNLQDMETVLIDKKFSSLAL